MERSHRISLVLLGAAVLLLTALGSTHAASVALMTIDELKAVLDDPDLVVLDVRKGKDWSSSEFKIKGATYHDPKAYATWSGTYPKDRKIVLYCA